MQCKIIVRAQRLPFIATSDGQLVIGDDGTRPGSQGRREKRGINRFRAIDHH